MKSDIEPDIQKLWKKFKQKKSMELRDKLILHYSPVVKYVAGRIAINLPANVEQADLISYGMFGLIDAIEKFDLKREIKFETYAISRIKGAIIDELRTLDWAPRSLRFKARELEKVYTALENKYKRSPTDEEVAEELNISVDELQEILVNLSQASLVALEEPWNVGQKGDSVSLIETLEDKTASEPSAVFEVQELKNILAEAIDNLPKREKMVIVLYYYDRLTLKEIGEILGVTESRVCQMHTKAILRLKGCLRTTMGLSS